MTIRTVLVAASTKLKREYPTDLRKGDDGLFVAEIKKEIPSTFLNVCKSQIVLSNGYVSSAWSVIPSSVSFSKPRSSVDLLKTVVKLAAERLRVRTKVVETESCFFPCDENSNGFFHWIGDVLPRIELLSRYAGLDELQQRAVVIPEMALFSYTLPSLEPYGLKKVHIVAQGQQLRSEYLETMTPVAPTGNFRPDVMQSLRKRFRDFFAPAAIQGRKIFISRVRAPRRHIVDEQKLWPVLDAFGFERIVVEEDLDFEGQVRTFAQASVLVGLHGAGLSNMLWMEENTQVLEIRFAGDTENNCYFSLASALGIRYSYLIADKQNKKMSVQDSDALVDTESLNNSLLSMGLERK